ncbi:MAG: NAD(P)/FAD-dependent oxidoreductase, partial [Bacteroidales bacterium]|nr:NAD(P)/FAD-dependent oxidoreductase [Bacteroidales bacterium]
YYNIPDTSSANQEYTDRIDLLTPMSWSEVEQFQQSSVGKRDRRYNELKEAKLEQVLDFVEEQLPQLRGNIERVYTSTPLTYMNYTATAQGSAYGIRKDCSNLMLTLLTPKTPVPNLFLTGQNLNLHGILGVSMTSFFTSAHIIGMENAVKGLEF